MVINIGPLCGQGPTISAHFRDATLKHETLGGIHQAISFPILAHLDAQFAQKCGGVHFPAQWFDVIQS